MPKVPIYEGRTVENKPVGPQYIKDTSGQTMALAGQINRAGQTAARAVYGIAHAEKQKADNALVNKAIGEAAFDIENLRSEAEQVQGEDALPAIPSSVPGPRGMPISTGAPGRDDPRPLVPRYLEKGDEVFSRAIAMAQTDDQRASIEAKLPAMRNGFLLRLNQHQSKQNAAVQKAHFESTLTYLTNNAAKLYMNPNEMKAAMLPIYEHIDEYSAAHGFPQTDAKDDPADIVVVETRSKVYTQAVMNALNDDNIQYAWDMYYGKGGKGGIEGLKNQSDDYGPAILESDKKDIESALRPLHDAQRGYQEAMKQADKHLVDPKERVTQTQFLASRAELRNAFTDAEGNVDIAALEAGERRLALEYSAWDESWKAESRTFNDANIEAVLGGMSPDKVDPSKKRYQTGQQNRGLWELYNTQIARSKEPKPATDWGYVATRTRGMGPQEKMDFVRANPQVFKPKDWHDIQEDIQGDMEQRSSHTKIDRVTGNMFGLPKYEALREGTDDEIAAQKEQFQHIAKQEVSRIEGKESRELTEAEIEDVVTKLWVSWYQETQGTWEMIKGGFGLFPGEQTYGQVVEDSRQWAPTLLAETAHERAAMTPGDWAEVEAGIKAPPGYETIEDFLKIRKPFEQIQDDHVRAMTEYVAADADLFAAELHPGGAETTEAERRTWIERGLADTKKREDIEDLYERLYAQQYQYPRSMGRDSGLVDKIDGAPIRKLQDEVRQRARYVNEAEAVERGAMSWSNLPPDRQSQAVELVKYQIWNGEKQPGDDQNPAVLWQAYTQIRNDEIQMGGALGTAANPDPLAAYTMMLEEGISPEDASAATGYMPAKESEQALRPRR